MSKKRFNIEAIEGIPLAKVGAVVQSYDKAGAKVFLKQQTDGKFTVRAVFRPVRRSFGKVTPLGEQSVRATA